MAGLRQASHSPLRIYKPGWREALLELSVLQKTNATPCSQPGLEPRTLDPETSSVATWPPRLHLVK